MSKQQTTVNFADIFHFAEKAPFKVHWNTCNDIFFNDLLKYKGYDNIYLSDLKHDLEYNDEHPESKYLYTDDQKLARRIMIVFMESKKLKEMLVLND